MSTFQNNYLNQGHFLNDNVYEVYYNICSLLVFIINMMRIVASMMNPDFFFTAVYRQVISHDI